MGVTLEGVWLIVSGLVLLSGSLYLIPALGKQLEKLAKFLGGFQTIIGVVAIVLGILNIDSLTGVVLVVAGLILAVGIMGSIPALGKYMVKAGKALGGFQTLIGVIAIVVAIWQMM